MSSVKEQFDIWKKEATVSFGKITKEVDAIIEPIQRNLKVNAIANIPADFGKFLYASLGDRVTGQRVSTINKTMIEKGGQATRIKQQMEEKKCKDIETFLTKYDCREHYNGSKTFNQTQAYLTVGRKFGISYVTGSTGDRVHTIFFDENVIFEYLTQEHVDLIKNKAKKECTQDFLNYRDSFVAGMSMFNKDNIIEINVPVQIAKLVTLYTQLKYTTSRYDTSDRLNAIVVESTHPDVVQYAVIQTPVFSTWNKYSNINTRDAHHGQNVITPFVAIRFGSVLEGTTKNNQKKTIQFGNVDITPDEYSHTLQTTDNNMEDVIIGTKLTEDTDDVQNFHVAFNKIERGDRYYSKDNGTMTDGIMLNMAEVVAHPKIQDAIKNRFDYFINKSVELQELKHKWADMYFLNAD